MPSKATGSRPEDLTARLELAVGVGDGEESLLRTLREVKNQIIGNKTKKLIYLQLGAVPRAVSILASDRDPAVIVEAAVVIGSFACGVEDGVRAVLDAGALSCLSDVLSHPSQKVVDAGARSLRMIFQSGLAPKYDLLKEKNMKFLISLLNSGNENVTELAASIIAHSCEMRAEQKALCDAGVLLRLFNLLEGSSNQRDACLDSVAAVVRKNSEVAAQFVSIDNGRGLNSLIKSLNDRNSQTRLLACVCLIFIGHASPRNVQDMHIRRKMMLILVELIEEFGKVGDDAVFALLELLSDDEELHKQAVSLNSVDKVFYFLHKNQLQPKRLQGVLLVFAELCSRLEECRCLLMSSSQVLDLLANALKHESSDVRIAACACVRSLGRSVKNLSAGNLAKERFIVPLVQLLDDPSMTIQVAALGAICNVSVGFTTPKSIFIQSGCVKQLVQLSKSMDPTLRLQAVCALRNLMFQADTSAKESIILELTLSTLASLICDSETSIQQEALALVCNLLDGYTASFQYVFADDGLIMNAIIRQLHGSSSVDVCIQGMYVLGNIAAGTESHKEALMSYFLRPENNQPSFIVKSLRSENSSLRTATMWCIVNLTGPDSPSSPSRIARLRDAGVLSLVNHMNKDGNEPCLDTKVI